MSVLFPIETYYVHKSYKSFSAKQHIYLFAIHSSLHVHMKKYEFIKQKVQYGSLHKKQTIGLYKLTTYLNSN